MSEKPNYILGEEHKGRGLFRGYDLVVDEETQVWLENLEPGRDPQIKASVEAERINRSGVAYLNGRLSGPRAITREMVGTKRRVGKLIGDQFEPVVGDKGRIEPNFLGYERRLATESARLTQIVREKISGSAKIELSADDLKGVGLEVWGISDLALSDSRNIQAPFAIDRDAWVNKLFRNIKTAVSNSHSVNVDFSRTDSQQSPIVISTRTAAAAK